MAIAYQSTSVSDADAPAAGILAQNAIRDALVAHPSGSWSVEEEFDAGGTIHWTVLKCDGVVSGVGFDYYVAIARLIATGQIGVSVGEVYTAATNQLSSFAPRSIPYYMNPSILADFSFSLGGGTPASFTLGNAFPGNDGTPYCAVPAAQPTMRFISIVEKDYAILMLNNVLWYIGALWDDIVPGPGLDAAVPVGCFNLYDGGVPTFGALTRHPIDAALAPMNIGYPHALQPLNYSLILAERQAMGTAVWLHPDRYQGGRVVASEVSAIMVSGSQGGNANNGGEKSGVLRGRFKNIRYTSFPWAVQAFDTIVVDGRKAVVMIDHGALDQGFVNPQDYNNNIRRGLVCDTGVAA